MNVKTTIKRGSALASVINSGHKAFKKAEGDFHTAAVSALIQASYGNMEHLNNFAANLRPSYAKALTNWAKRHTRFTRLTPEQIAEREAAGDEVRYLSWLRFDKESTQPYSLAKVKTDAARVAWREAMGIGEKDKETEAFDEFFAEVHTEPKPLSIADLWKLIASTRKRVEKKAEDVDATVPENVATMLVALETVGKAHLAEIEAAGNA